MGKAGFYLIIPIALFCLVLPGCSGGKEAEPTKATVGPGTKQAVEAIKDYAKKPLDKARAAQQLGDEKTKAIDEAVKRQWGSEER
jgi:hypothetical protein